VTLFRKPLPVLLREAQAAIEHRSVEAATPVVLWQGLGEDDTHFDAKLSTAQKRLPRHVKVIAACTPRSGPRLPA
jgi:hypothetical protein